MTTDASWVETMPEIYDRCLGPALFMPFADHLAGVAAELAPHRVLELAAGTGIATAALLRTVPHAEIVATDLNPAMVAWAASRIAGPDWQVANAQHLDLPSGAFDLVVCQFGVMFFPDKPGAFAEVARVLEPGGTMLFTVWDAVEKSPFPAAMVTALHALLPLDPPDFIDRVPHGYHDQVRVAADLTAGGLEMVGFRPLVLRGRSAGARALSEGFSLGTPLRFGLLDRGSVDQLSSALADEMLRQLGPGPLEGDLAGILISARKPGPPTRAGIAG